MVCTECLVLSLCGTRGSDLVITLLVTRAGDVVHQSLNVRDNLGGIQGLVISPHWLTIVI